MPERPAAPRGRARPRVLLIDNYDSFTYNLASALDSAGARLTVRRNDAISVREIAALHPSGIVISPGPGRPEAAGITTSVVENLAPSIPTIGVCLGHQAIAQAFGGRIVRARRPVHGKTSVVCHDGRTIFRGLPRRFAAARYHSLTVSRRSLPRGLEISAWAEDGTVMGIRHRALPIEGIQFHPESFLTAVGARLLQNAVDWFAGWQQG